jgi:hypothetical protein
MVTPKNLFVYKKTKQECIGKSDDWVKQATNEILADLTKQINREGKAPRSDQLDRIESSLQALKDELASRGIK